MKNFKIVSILALAAIATAATAKADEPVSKPKQTNYELLKQAAKEMSGELENAASCEFKVQETRDGITLMVRDSKSASVYLDIANDALIKIEAQALERDGSFADLFKIAGQGELRLVHADDAFERAEITDRTGRELSCELDM
jgi:hypothetical protein